MHFPNFSSVFSFSTAVITPSVTPPPSSFHLSVIHPLSSSLPPSHPSLPHPGTDPVSIPLSSPSIFPCICWSLLLLPGGDRDQLLGSLGNVVGALDDLLSKKLIVHCGGPGLRRRRLTALHLQPWGTGSQQAKRAVDCVQRWALQRNKGKLSWKIKNTQVWKWKGHKGRNDRKLTLGKSEAISVTAAWIFSEHGTKLRNRENRIRWELSKAAKPKEIS